MARIILPPIKPSNAIAKRYYARLRALIDSMLGDQGKNYDYWQARFDEVSPVLAIEFVTSAGNAVRAQYMREFPSFPFWPRYDMLANIEENVALIKSIPKVYHDKVELAVQESFSRGGDLHYLSERLEQLGGITRRRAVFIAMDQSRKVSADYNQREQIALGISEAIWHHSSASRVPRPAHLQAGRERLVYNTVTGVDLHDGEGLVIPGQLINCRCGSESIVPRHLERFVRKK